MPSEPPPAYDWNPNQDGISSNFQNINYESRNPKPEGYNSTVLSPTVPPGGIEGPGFFPNPPYPYSVQPLHIYPNQSFYFGSYPHPPGPVYPHPPEHPYLQGFRPRSGLVDAYGRRYRMSHRGYMERLTDEQYHSARMVQAGIAVLTIIAMIIFIIIAIKMMTPYKKPH